ncbi:hypothetical protein F2P56_013568 [Juglans regia]|uniref:Uncharacterized protein n=1 Tax=Juglans regia TaxID=51240 RepID=A0A834CZ80_JUGRE|nr:hypothetical protein F2P56_013568 [Juglans regia]
MKIQLRYLADDLEQNANTSFFPPCGCISFHFKDTQSAALWELTYLMGRSLRISFLHPTTVMFLMLLALIISSISPIVKPDTILSSTQMSAEFSFFTMLDCII